MARYGRHIEADLYRAYRVDLQELWSARRWRLLLNLIDHLPRASHTRQAMAEDEEHVAMVVEAMDGKEGDVSPPMAEYDASVERLDRVIDSLQVVANILIAANGGKPQKIKPQPRPATAFERVQHRRRSVKHQMTVNRVLGRGVDG